MKISCDAFTIVKEEEIKELNTKAYILKHNKTGARVAILDNDDENKVFYIGFRTPAPESTGVMHILEHSVLCGSEKFPIKDPFIELAKGSLNTFLNAMTFPDKTVYPVASCNDKDFKNLMYVYLDAVFYPNILKNKYTFMQEGWHYELNNPEDELTINGVVYNEMKGAFSSPDDVLEREVFNSLFPDTEYGQESGGDPDHIPELTYEHFVDTYKKYYHPSNSYIYLYGKMDFNERLEFIDREYLSRFDAIEIDTTVKYQKPFDRQLEIQKEYSITENEEADNNSYISMNWAFESNLNPEEYVAIQVLDYALGSCQGAVLKEALVKEDIGKEVYTTYENGIKQPIFSVVAKKADEKNKDKFKEIVYRELDRICREGFNRDMLKAALNIFEFRYREADFGTYPPGLMYGLQMLDSWLYDDELPFIHIAQDNTFAKLREALDSDYYEKLVEKLFIKNNHSSVMVVTPKKNLTFEKEQQLSARLKKYKAGLTQEELSNIIDETKALEEFQNREDTEEAKATIPMLTKDDIKKETWNREYSEIEIDGIPGLYHNIPCHGIDYIRLMFRVNNIPKDLAGYLPFMKIFTGYVDTEKHTYGELFNYIFMNTGGVNFRFDIYNNAKKDDIGVYYSCIAKCFEGKQEKIFEIADEIINYSLFEDEKRLRDICMEALSQLEASMMQSGHVVAYGRAASYYSKSGAVSDFMSGLEYYKAFRELCNNFEERKYELKHKLKELYSYVFSRENLFVDFTGSKDEFEIFKNLVKDFKNKLDSHEKNKDVFDFIPVKLNEGITSSSQVQYVCRAGNYKNKGLEYKGTLRVLKTILGYGYLWENIRVKGGAYGCMSGFSKTGESYFVSYRDPKLKETIDVYEKIPEYLKNFTASEKEITKYLIGTISDLDTPLTPYLRAGRELTAYLHNSTMEEFQKERDEILAVSVEDIRGLAQYVEAIMDEKAVCVVGNEDRIKSNSEIFDNIVNLI